MIEPIMYLGIGFLLASLACLVMIPLVHSRAVRLTVRRLEAATPVSMAEIQADKDQLRAEFAMSTRQLEMSVDQLKSRTSGQLAELGKKTEAINKLKLELGEKAAVILGLEAREKGMRDQIRSSEDELEIKTSTMHEATRSLSDKEAALAKISSELGDRTSLTDSQRVEIVALRTQVEALKSQVDRAQDEISETQDRLHQERKDADVATRDLQDERQRVETFSTKAAELERQLIAQTKEAETLSGRMQALEARLTEQGRVLAEREYEVTHLRGEVENSRRVESDLRTEIVSLDNRHSGTHSTLRSEKALIEHELEHTREERSQLQREVANMKREAEATWASERVENALLRERINDIATEVARLTMVLEGPGSPIESLLAGQGATPANGKPPVQPKTGEAAAEGNLADRIRALQSRASRTAPAT